MIEEWIEQNKLQAEVQDGYLSIDKDKYYFLEHKLDKIFDKDFHLIISSEEEVKEGHYVYSFGGNYYYTPWDETNKPSLKPFKYLGQAKVEIDIPFVHLGVHGKYEMLNGSRDYSDWCDKAKFLGHKSLGICEKNTLAGILQFQIACQKVGLKPILGETITVKTKKTTFDSKVYVVNEIGWKNLLAINSKINIDNVGHIEEDDLVELGKGLIIVLGNDFLLSAINQALYTAKFDDVFYQIDTVQWDNKDHDVEYLTNVKNYLDNHIQNFSPILINDSYYLDKGEAHIKKLLNKIGDVKYQYSSQDQYFKDVEDSFEIFEQLFKEGDDDRLFNVFEQAARNTTDLSNLVDFTVDLNTFHIPIFEMKGLPKEYLKEDNRELFWDLMDEGMLRIDIEESQKDIYYKRIEEEFELIERGGYIDYFLILWDIIRWCKTQDILVGPGRGSAAGCLIAYLLEITQIDPLKYDLLFSRFLNSGRIGKSLPDIDVDFEAERRRDVMNYIENKYGQNYVCNVSTYTTLKIKQALKDLGKIKGVDFKFLNILTSNIYIKEGKDGNFEEIFIAAQKDPQLKGFIQSNLDLINNLGLILRQPKAKSIHPCATIVLPRYEGEDIYNYLPLKTHEGLLLTEWEAPQLEEAGFLKEDILGIRQLDKIKSTLNFIKESTDEDVDIYSIPMDDQNVMELFRQGQNGDVFQFGSPGLTSYCKEVKPVNVEELITMVALYRPGPIQSGAHFSYVKLKNGLSVPEYDFNLKEVTEATFGLYIFQEQVMKATQVLGGFSGAETDDVRKAMGKKIASVLVPYKKRFIDEAIKKGCPEKEAKEIWTKLEVFSAYGFNKSHAAAYAILGYITQWLKYYYPVQFWTSALQYAEEEDDIIRYMAEIALNKDIKIVPPDINKSDIAFKFEGNSIYWSLSRVKFLGEVGLEAILTEREKNGDFFEVGEFFNRVPKDKVNKRMVTNLILSGSFDELYDIDEDITKRIELIEAYYKKAKIYDDVDGLLKTANNKKKWWLLLKQKELSGLGGINYIEIIKASKTVARGASAAPCLPINILQTAEDGIRYAFGGILKYVHIGKHVSGESKGKNFAKLHLDFNNEELIILLWNPEYEKKSELLDSLHINVGECVVIGTGTVKEGGKYPNQFNVYSSSNDQIEFLIGDKLEPKQKISVMKGDTVRLKDEDITGKITKYPDNQNIEITMEGGNTKVIAKSDIKEIVKDE